MMLSPTFLTLPGDWQTENTAASFTSVVRRRLYRSFHKGQTKRIQAGGLTTWDGTELQPLQSSVQTQM